MITRADFIYCSIHSIFFFFNDTATTEIYTLSLHDALPISMAQDGYLSPPLARLHPKFGTPWISILLSGVIDRKSTRLNSSHVEISYAVFCLKKKKKKSLYIIINNIENTSNVNTLYYKSQQH